MLGSMDFWYAFGITIVGWFLVRVIYWVWCLYRQNYPLPGVGRSNEDPADEIIRRYYKGAIRNKDEDN